MVTLAVINCDFVENPILNFEIISVEKTLVSIFTSILTATTFTLHIRSPQSSKKTHFHVTFCLTVASSSALWNNVIAIGIEVITSRPHDTNMIYRQYHHIKSPYLAYHNWQYSWSSIFPNHASRNNNMSDQSKWHSLIQWRRAYHCLMTIKISINAAIEGA